MEIVMGIFTAMKFFVSVDFLSIIGAIVLITNFLIGVAMLIPGEQPDKFLQGVVDFLAKYSKKPKE